MVLERRDPSAGNRQVSPDFGAISAAGDLLRALGAPHRLAIVLELANGPRCVHELVELLHISPSLASQHLRVLRNTGLAIGTRRGKETAYTLTDEHVAHIARDALAHSTELNSARTQTHRTTRMNISGEEQSAMTTAHESHPNHEHSHGEGCGHVAVDHGDHTDYLHDGHIHRVHDDHVDECTNDVHLVHEDHEHVHGADCGHESVRHGDHDDYIHEGHRHVAHEDHWDEH
jgi:DNA-binding transcriptional ArsR family regulator